MSFAHEFCDHGPGCRPAMFDATTGKVAPDDSPIMIRMNHIWNHETTYAERKAFIDVTVHNRHSDENLRLANKIMDRLREQWQ